MNRQPARFRILHAGLLLVLPAAWSVPAAAQVVPSAGQTQTVSFTTSEGTWLAFDLSPDGEMIVFDLLGQLWTLPVQGGDAVPLTHAVSDVAEDLDPVISPDGEWIAFQSDRPAGRGLWIVPAAGGEPRLLADTEIAGQAAAFPAWSPDGRELAFARGRHLYVHDIAAGASERLDFDDAPAARPEHPAWLGSGQLLVRAAEGSPRLYDTAGSLRVVDAATGATAPFPTRVPGPLAPAPAPDGSRVAYFAADDDGRVQLWLQDGADGDAAQLTWHEDVVPHRARWTPDGRELVYAADGRLWAVAPGDGDPRAIPFRAGITFERYTPALPPLRFAAVGEQIEARGHMGLALAPDGERIALLALNRLWVWRIGQPPRPVADVPPMAQWPSWSPDGRHVAWSAGVAGAEDIHATDIETGQTRRVTALEGRAERPAWSPDGEWIAFVYRPGMLSPQTAMAGGRVAVLRAGAGMVTDTADLLIPEARGVLRLPGYAATGQERPTWSPASDAIIAPAEQGPAEILTLAGEPIVLELPGHPAFVTWSADSTLVYVDGNLLYHVRLHEDGTTGAPVRLSDGAASYPSVTPDGSILFVTPDGYAVRRPDGGTQALGWPLTYTVAAAPAPVLIRGAVIVPGTGTSPGGPADILIEDGRITRIAGAGSISAPPGTQVIAGYGRYVMPGLIDLHQHGWDDDVAVYAASLYHGVTTIREMGGPIARNAALGEAAVAGAHPGPRVVLGGFQIYPGAQPPAAGAGLQRPATADDGERALALAQAFGASYVKMRLPGRLAPGAELVRSAGARGLRIGGHCAHALPLIAAGTGQLEHLAECGARVQAVPRADLVTLYEAAGVHVIPTLVHYRGMLDVLDRGAAILDDPGVGPFVTPLQRFQGGFEMQLPEAAVRAAYAQTEPIVAHGRATVAALHRAGIRIGSGTDTPQLPGAIHIELEELVHAGLSPVDAILAATRHAAHILGAGGEIGTVEAGRWADLLILDADPLADIRNTRTILHVIQGGRVIERAAIIEFVASDRRH